MIKLTSKDWVRMLMAFLLGVAVTLLVIQLTGGQLFQGFLTKTLYVAPVTTTTTDVRTLEVESVEPIQEKLLSDEEFDIIDLEAGAAGAPDTTRLDLGRDYDLVLDEDVISGIIEPDLERADAPGDLTGDLDPDGQVDLADLAELETGWLKDPDLSAGESDDTLYVIDDDN